MGSETFEGIYFEKYSEGLRYFVDNLVLIILLINIENIQSLLLVSLLIVSR